jgi:8-oxo-dGTP diphosphatase
MAGGVVVIRDNKVLLVHRPRYDDWSFPKGKVEGAEIYPVTAVRECDEETGFNVTLGPYLGVDKYTVPEGDKQVHYWSAQVREDIGFAPDEEVDKISWVSTKDAAKKLTYKEDIEFLDRANALPQSTPLIVLRHAKAMKRSDYVGDKDALRPLSGKGRRQSKVLVDALDAYGIENLVSSPYVRCLETLHRYAKYLDTKIEVSDPLSESGNEQDPAATEQVVRELLLNPEPTVLCSHRPVMTTVMSEIATQFGFAGSDLETVPWEAKLSPAAFFVVHRQFHTDGTVTLVNIEQHDVPLD